jgi:hypothetical protein
LALLWVLAATAQPVPLLDIFSAGTTPPGPFRWVDVADQAYAGSYRNAYDYTQSTVNVTIPERAESFAGTLEATGLKPNFAYQLKLIGDPSRESNEWIGYAGRWWQESWNGSSWGSGQNLNSKGNGSFPNPNDLVYQSRRDIANGSSPTGKQYRYQGYLLASYFVTDETGAASVSFDASNSYHVLWKTTQRSRTSSDGPIASASFDPDPSEDAYDTDFTAKSVSIFGEWERLPAGGIVLPDGDYGASMILTEESFHGSGGTYAGFWASAMSAWMEFSIGSGPELISFSATPIRGAAGGLTADREVSVELSAGDDVSGWWIGESATEPSEGWLNSPPSSYSIAGSPGAILLYARVRNDAGSISDPLQAQLIYEPPREFRVSMGGESVVLGQWSGATTLFDADFDSSADPGAVLWLGEGLSQDFRPPGEAQWRLRVDQSGEVSWETSARSAGEWLLLQPLADAVPSAPPRALEADGSALLPAGDYRVMLGLPQVLSLPARAGWRLVGGSVHTPLSMGSLFPGADVWRWGSGYEPCLTSDGLIPGHGYWTYSRQAITQLEGLIAPVTLHLKPGWNLVGVAESAALDSPAIDAVWSWRGHFRRATQLEPGEAYWVYATSDLVLEHD